MLCDKVKALIQEVQLLKTRHQLLEHANELVIGILHLENFRNLKMAVFAVVSTIYPEMTDDDILAVRPLCSTLSVNTSLSISTTAAPAPTTTSLDGTLLLAPKASTTSLLVTLSSAALALAVLSAKIKIKKASYFADQR